MSAGGENRTSDANVLAQQSWGNTESDSPSHQNECCSTEEFNKGL